MIIEVVRHESTLRRERWAFHVWTDHGTAGLCVSLAYYAVESRETTRKRTWSAEKEYADRERRSIPQRRWIGEPPLPDDVKAEVLRRVIEGAVFRVREVER